MSDYILGGVDDLIERLHKRADIRDQIATRKSVQEGKPDRLNELLREAAAKIESMADYIVELEFRNKNYYE